MKLRRFDVYLGASLVNYVFFDENMSAREVRRSLIDHDGNSEQISVYRVDAKRPAYDDMARVTHPEELK